MKRPKPKVEGKCICAHPQLSLLDDICGECGKVIPPLTLRLVSPRHPSLGARR